MTSFRNPPGDGDRTSPRSAAATRTVLHFDPRRHLERGGLNTDDQIVPLIDDIYALIRNPAGLQDLVGRICDWRGADMALLTAPALPGCAPVPLIAYKMDFAPVLASPEMLMRPEFARRAIATGCAPGVFKFEELMPPHEQQVNDYWQAIMAPLGIASGILTMVRTPEDNLRPVTLNLYRRCSSSPFSSDDVKSMEALLPHLRRALGVLLDAPLGVSSFEMDSLYSAIDTAAFFLDQAGNVAHCNDAAERLLRLEDGLMLEEDRLTLSDSELQRDLDAALGRVIGSSWSTKLRKGAELLAPRPSGAPALLLVAAPMGAENPIATCAASIRCVVFAYGETPALDGAVSNRMQRLYGLTEAEAEIAVGIALGMSLSELAERRGTKLITVRGQIKQAFAKTGARRQSALAALVSRLRR